MNRSKAKGTAGETAVTRYAREHGFPLADRRPLKGNADEGDILLTVGLIAEVKSGKAAQVASVGQIEAWMKETSMEVVHANAGKGILVVQRQGIGVGRPELWDCYQYRNFKQGEIGVGEFRLISVPICTSLEHGLFILRTDGWGDPL